jgi:hypothetical protein
MQPSRHPYNRLLLLGLSAALLSACGSDTSTPGTAPVTPNIAVIAGIAADFGSSAIALASATAPYGITEGYLASDRSDISVAAYGDHFYRIGRYNQDNITKVSFANPGVEEWQFSTNSSILSSNPYDVLFVSETKAYVLRFGESSVWIVDPSVTNTEEAAFKTGEIDLSAYDATDGVPNMASGIIHAGKLYIALQNLDELGDFSPRTGYVAVIDTATDTEVDTSGGTKVLKGIELSIKNPGALAVRSGSLFVQGVGIYAKSYTTPPSPAEYSGGISRINLLTYDEELLIDDGDSTNHPYGQISDMAIVSDTVGYFTGYASYASESLFRFNPTTGSVNSEAVAEADSVDIQAMEVAPDGTLWLGIGDFAAPEIRIIDPADDSVKATIPTAKNATKIVFASPASQ